MKSFDAFCGSEDVKSSVSALLSSEGRAATLLLIGERGLGKNGFARLVAESWLDDCHALVQRGVHPDCVLLLGSGQSGQIPVEAVRDATFELTRGAVTANGRRVLLVPNAEKLNRSSAAALLKFLEEPPDGVLPLLTAVSEDRLLPTIRSRAMPFTLKPPKEEEAIRYLVEKGEEETKITALARLFRGRIGLIQKALADEAFAGALTAAKSFTASLQAGDRLSMLARLDEMPDRQALEEMIFCLWFTIGEAVKNGENRLSSALLELGAMADDLTRNVSPKLFAAMLVKRMSDHAEPIGVK